MSLRQTADYLGVSPGALYQMRHTGDGPPGFKVGARVRYRRAEVDAWLDARRDAPRPVA
ncbi:helix-turn-helix domain-containing protein [uncultured Nocardioides sp.]|uniref:helix-turn-helix transcriptional regulator n=1 Tax=uncultured Nocardioides sp. TaxID=198441 RepID=UPI00261C8D23|nr:helix-turn-helix domain-containing protein [uncultured Nocardioides sp.]